MYKILILCAIISAAQCRSVFVGQIYEQNGIRKVYETDISANTIPFFKRENYVNFEYTDKIKGISITDLDNGLAEPSITSGGLGFNSVNIKLKSERGAGFNFHIAIYA